MGFPGGSAVKNQPANAGDVGSSSGSERSWQPTPVFLPEKSHDRETWWATMQRVTRFGHDLVTKQQ